MATVADILAANNKPVSSNDIVAAQDSLLQAYNAQRAAADRAARQNQQLAQQQINVANAAGGTLFSTRPTFLGAQQAAKTYIPQVVKNASTWGQNTIKARQSVASALAQIQAYNDAANQLSGGSGGSTGSGGTNTNTSGSQFGNPGGLTSSEETANVTRTTSGPNPNSADSQKIKAQNDRIQQLKDLGMAWDSGNGLTLAPGVEL